MKVWKPSTQVVQAPPETALVATPKANALHSLYGGKKKRLALAGNVGGLERQQVVLTPEWLLDGCREAEGPIIYDPCTEVNNPTRAQYFSTVRTNGLKVNWTRFAGLIYVNPPFAKLQVWLDKANAMAALGARIFFLAPLRPQRTWFCEAVAGYPVYALRPFPFVGQKQAFPAPLCLIGFNVSVPVLTLKNRNMITGLSFYATARSQILPAPQDMPRLKP
jgi:hypothetical protein